MEIETSRLRLRRARLSDAEAMHAVLSDPRAMRYWSTLPHTDLAQTRDWLGEKFVEGCDDFVIEHEGRVIGKAGCYRLPEIGYILHPNYWGRGFASEALGAVISHIFAAHEIPAIIADVDPRNQASLRLLARLGFHETHRASRTWLVGDEWCDSIYLTLPRTN